MAVRRVAVGMIVLTRVVRTMVVQLAGLLKFVALTRDGGKRNGQQQKEKTCHRRAI